MKIFDMRKNLVQYTDKRIADFDEKAVEALDEMLNAYDIPHSISLPYQGDIDELEELGDVELTIFYMEDDEMTFDLVYLLWSKKYRNASDKKIAENAWKITKHWNRNHGDKVSIPVEV